MVCDTACAELSQLGCRSALIAASIAARSLACSQLATGRFDMHCRISLVSALELEQEGKKSNLGDSGSSAEPGLDDRRWARRWARRMACRKADSMDGTSGRRAGARATVPSAET